LGPDGLGVGAGGLGLPEGDGLGWELGFGLALGDGEGLGLGAGPVPPEPVADGDGLGAVDVAALAWGDDVPVGPDTAAAVTGSTPSSRAAQMRSAPHLLTSAAAGRRRARRSRPDQPRL
jgi:hypothetical protein